MSIEPLAPEPGVEAVEAPAEVSFERPSPLVCVLWLASRISLWLVVGTGLAIARGFGLLGSEGWQAWVFNPSPAWLIPPVHIVFSLASYRSWGYRLRVHDLLVRHGVFTHEFVAVPLARVQQVDVSSGPLERLLGLATLVVHTAGTRAARTRIPGLPRDRATALRDELSRHGDELAE